MAELPNSFYIIYQSLTLLSIVVQVVALVLSIIAVRGFKGAPINRVLKPIPVVFACMILVNLPWASLVLFSIPYSQPIYAAVFSIGVLAAVVAAFNATMLLTERRDL